MNDQDHIDYRALGLLWPIDEWYRFEDAARTRDTGPRGAWGRSGADKRGNAIAGEVA